MPQKSQNTNKLVFLALLLAQALILGYVERWIPMPFLPPGAKLGLANIISLVCLYHYGLPEAFWVQGLRVLLLSFLFGSMMSFFFSIAGAICSLLAMGFLKKAWGKKISLPALSIVGAVFHHMGQLLVAALVIQNLKIYFYGPVLLLLSIPTGLFVGFAAHFMIKALDGLPFQHK